MLSGTSISLLGATGFCESATTISVGLTADLLTAGFSRRTHFPIRLQMTRNKLVWAFSTVILVVLWC